MKTYIAIEACPSTARILERTIENFPDAPITKLDRAIAYGDTRTVDFLELSLTGSRLATVAAKNLENETIHKVDVMQLDEIVK